MGPRIVRRLTPALLAVIAALALVAAADRQGGLQVALYLVAAIAIGGLIGSARLDV